MEESTVKVLGYVYGLTADVFSKVSYPSIEEVLKFCSDSGFSEYYIGTLVEDTEVAHDSHLLPPRLHQDIVAMTDEVLAKTGVSVKGFKVIDVKKYTEPQRRSVYKDWS